MKSVDFYVAQWNAGLCKLCPLIKSLSTRSSVMVCDDEDAPNRRSLIGARGMIRRWLLSSSSTRNRQRLLTQALTQRRVVAP